MVVGGRRSPALTEAQEAGLSAGGGGGIVLRRRCKQTRGVRPHPGLITSLQLLSHAFIL